MGKIGSFGGVTFEVSSNKVLTFNDFSRNGSARWSVHDINQKKPMPEFLGPGQDSLSIKVKLSSYLGVNPLIELNKLRSFRDNGKYGSFIIGNSSISSGYWYIEDITETYNHVDGKGRIISIEATLNIKEYPKPVVAKVTQKPKPKPKPKPQVKKPPPSKKKRLGVITIKVGMLNCRATPSLKGRIVKVLRKNQKYTVYGIKKTDIPWYDMGGGKWTSAVSKYTSLKKG
ncbi:phage tail protein [Neobacillus mesonae]|uniref:phage tail protein n=1 Tax=Neobacillus mesonae TaxID=1193713 RepID=UPI00203E0A06|nr:phage tail protein [Neobacillus mesonae]MCM3567843.1 phage tail protein [Neobacillus mesonae]